MQPVPIQTRWAREVSPQNALPEYPRPQMVRPRWQNLNGLWEYAIVDSVRPRPQKFDGSILVPFPLESALSGVKKPLLPNQKLWYKKTLTIPAKNAHRRYIIHFGAVDFQATLFVNGRQIGQHTGGYQEFEFDITDLIHSGENEILLSVWDPTEKGNNPKGKQVLHPQNIMYTAISGIWQTVWLEILPDTYIASLKITPDIDKQEARIVVRIYAPDKPYQIEIETPDHKTISPLRKDVSFTEMIIPVPSPHLWSPQDPYLYDCTIRIIQNKKTIDEVKSYFGMRKIEIKKDSLGDERIFLNNQFTFNLGVLDQGYWPDGLYTAPTDEALKWDIEAIKSMGFNTIRKHIKIEPARWYYHCDKLGMLVWQDMPFPANLSEEARSEFETESADNIRQLYNYPSIVCWVLFNEGWNAYDQKRLTSWAKSNDPTRIINGHTGENYCQDCPKKPADKWVSSDLTDVHIYPGPGIPPALAGKARSLGEWGGVRVPTPGHQWDSAGGWGYIQTTPQQFSRIYYNMIRHLAIYKDEGLSASIYTQPFDVEIEENGLVTYDREVFKIPASVLKKINQKAFSPVNE